MRTLVLTPLNERTLDLVPDNDGARTESVRLCDSFLGLMDLFPVPTALLGLIDCVRGCLRTAVLTEMPPFLFLFLMASLKESIALRSSYSPLTPFTLPDLTGLLRSILYGDIDIRIGLDDLDLGPIEPLIPTFRLNIPLTVCGLIGLPILLGDI